MFALREEEIDKIVVAITGKRPLAKRRLYPSRRVGHMEYWVIEVDRSVKAFLKIAIGDRTKKMINDEIKLYRILGERSFLAEYFGDVQEESYSAIMIEDLSNCMWSPPWSGSMIDQVLYSLEEFRKLAIPEISRKVSDFNDSLLGWENIKGDFSRLVSKNICKEAWLQNNLSLLITQSQKAIAPSKDLIHFDIRSDNVCFKNDKAILLDWSWYCKGAFDLQLASWALTLSLEKGGMPPYQFLPDIDPCYVSLISGYFAQFVGVPCPDGSHVRQLQYKQLLVAMDWLLKIL